MASSMMRQRGNLSEAIAGGNRWRRSCGELGALRAWIIGSVARGTAGAFSDLDVIVEAETEERAIDRTGRFRSMLELDVDPDLLVYTPKELDARFASLLGEGAFLDRFYTATRYPDAWSGSARPALKYCERDANDPLADAEKLIEAARAAMLEWDERAA